MADKFIIPSDRQPWLDPSTGLITRPWFLFLQGMFTRMGGAAGTGSAAFDAAISDLQMQDAMAESFAPALKEQSAAQATALAAQAIALALAVNDLGTADAFAGVPNHEIGKRVDDLEIIGAFAK